MESVFTTYRPSEPDSLPSFPEKTFWEDTALDVPKWNIGTPEAVAPPITPSWERTAEPEFYEPAPLTSLPETTETDYGEEDDTEGIVSTARSLVGGKYKWGGTRPDTGLDCSGLVQYVFRQHGIELPRTAIQQGGAGEAVTLDQARPGDIIWFGSNNSPSGQHVGLVSRIDEEGFHIIDAAGKRLGVVERLLPDLQIKSIRRVTAGSLASRVIDYFTGKGLTRNQARGIYGNLMQESGGNHTATNSRSGAYGLAQWLGSRKDKLLETYGSNPSERQQLDFIWHELNTSETKALKALLGTETTSDATRVFATLFERAGKNEMNMNKRIKYATQA